MTAGDLTSRTLERAGETGGFYTSAQAVAALNQAQRLFTFLTLCLEATVTLPLAANQRFYHCLTVWPDFLAPLRIRVVGSGGAKVVPARLQDFDAYDMQWQTAVGVPKRYACLGFDFLAFDQVPDDAGRSLSVTYAQAPPALVNAIDVPVIPEQFHPCLIDWSVPRLRAQEGGSEFNKTLPMVQSFLDEVNRLASYVRARNLAHRYDRMPFELQSFDRSTLAGIVGVKA